MSEIRIMGIKVRQRAKNAEHLQSILTRYGTTIRTRLGLHYLNHEQEDTNGLIVLELAGDTKLMDQLEEEINGQGNYEVKKMVFS